MSHDDNYKQPSSNHLLALRVPTAVVHRMEDWMEDWGMDGKELTLFSIREIQHRSSTNILLMTFLKG
jgi:hypothetical protein